MGMAKKQNPRLARFLPVLVRPVPRHFEARSRLRRSTLALGLFGIFGLFLGFLPFSVFYRVYIYRAITKHISESNCGKPSKNPQKLRRASLTSKVWESLPPRIEKKQNLSHKSSQLACRVLIDDSDLGLVAFCICASEFPYFLASDCR